MKLSERAHKVAPFYVMEVFKAAQKMAKDAPPATEKMIFLNVGEPDFTAPPLVREAAERAIRDGRSQYTDATGLMALRERISGWYAQRFGLDVSPNRIVVTAGASAALQLACMALVDAGDEILMPDPSYPCNRQFVQTADGVAKMIPSGPSERFQLSAEQVKANWGAKTKGVLLASPSNPTGTSLDPAELRRIAEVVRERDGVLLLDEIYLGLSYDERYGHSALGLGQGLDDHLVSINSFSKYFNMTGWRLGWLVAPESLVPAIERLAQNLYICPSTIAQHAALACFEAESIAEYERRRAEFKARRDFFIPALQGLGLNVPVMPDGAFYAWADAQSASEKLGVKDSWDLSFALMERARLVVTPARDFSTNEANRFHLRFSTANSMAQLQEAVSRLKALLG